MEKPLAENRPKFRLPPPVLTAMAMALLALSPLRAEIQGLYVSYYQGESYYMTARSREFKPIDRGRAFFSGAQIKVAPGALLRLVVGQRASLGLEGPALLKVERLRRGWSHEHSYWDVLLDLPQGCLWVDTRYNFENRLDLSIRLPDRTLKVPPKARWVASVGVSRTARFGILEGPRYLPAFCDGNGALQPVSPEAGVLLELPASPTAQAQDAGTPGPAPTPALPCPLLLQEAQRPITLLLLTQDYDVTRKIHLRQNPWLGPALVDRLQDAPGLRLADQSGSTLLARRAVQAFSNGGDLLARRVGRELGARWVLVGNASVRDFRHEEWRHGRRHGVPMEQGLAEARILDVATGDLLATDASNTRVAVGRAGRDEAIRRALSAVSTKLAGYMAWHLQSLLKGKPHPDLVGLTFHGITPDDMPALRRGLSGLESVQHIFLRKFDRRLVRLDVTLRAPRGEFLKALESLHFKDFSLSQTAQSGDGGISFAVLQAPGSGPRRRSRHGRRR